jgi:hypothetical protein
LKCGVKYPYKDEDAILCDAGYEPSGRRYLLHYRRVEGGERLKRERVAEILVTRASPDDPRTVGDLLSDVEANAVERVVITADYNVKVIRRNGDRYELGRFVGRAREHLAELAPALRQKGVTVVERRELGRRALFGGR